MAKAKNQLNMRLSDEDMGKLRELADQEYRTMSGYLKSLFLSKWDDQQKTNTTKD